jgi:hypothetical protein
MAEVLKFASENYDVIFLDGPPVLPVPDAGVIAKITDKTVLLIEWKEPEVMAPLERLGSALLRGLPWSAPQFH